MLVLHYGLYRDTEQQLGKNGFRLVSPDSPIETGDDLRAYAEYFKPDILILDVCKAPWVIEEARSLRDRLDRTCIIGIFNGPPVFSGDSHDWWSDTHEELLRAGFTCVLRGPADSQLICAQAKALRIASRQSASAKKYVFGDTVLRFDHDTLTATVAGERITLKPMHRAILGILLEGAGRTQTKDRLMQSLYFDRPVDEWPEPKIIDVFICQLRAGLRKAHPALSDIVETVWGRGYVIARQASEDEKILRPDFAKKVA